VGFVIGVALLGAAMYGAWGQREAIGEALRHAAATRWWVIGAAMVLPLLNWLVTCGIFYVLTRAHSERVRPVEMAALVGASWLFNYLPASPGLFGRVVYHQKVHGIPWTTSAGVVIAAMITSVCVIIVTLFAGAVLGFESAWFVAAPLVLAAGSVVVAWVGRRDAGRWRMAVALALRCVDLYVWAARYYVILLALGMAPTPATALGLGVVSQAAVLIPFLGNGLGIREWAVGLAGPALPGWAAAAGRGTALSVDLVNRACELVVAVPVGLGCAAYLARRDRPGAAGTL
jgi:uncharacterized membrane protein YbhN (UPF0104 family)